MNMAEKIINDPTNNIMKYRIIERFREIETISISFK